MNSLLNMFKEKVMGPYKRAARIFVRQTKRDLQENASWEALSAERQQEWEDGARDARSNIQPMLFEYAERRSKGIELPPGRDTWPRGEKQAKRDRETIELGKLFALYFVCCVLCFFFVEQWSMSQSRIPVSGAFVHHLYTRPCPASFR